MCNFCNKQKPKNFVSRIDANGFTHKDIRNDSIADRFDAIIEGNKLMCEYDAYSCDSSFSEEIQIMYCPMCGRKL
jgi:Zn finger protein HypA/HybF involved in hydrogenase expression